MPQVLTAALLLAVSTLTALAGEPRPLPDGAVARFGPDRFHHPIDVRRAALSPDGSVLAVHQWIRDRAEISVWDVDSGKLIDTIPLPPDEDELADLFFAPDGSLVWVRFPRLMRWTRETGANEVTDRLRPSSPRFTFSPDNKWVAVVTHDRAILSFAWPDGGLRFESTIPDIPGSVPTVAAAYSHNGERIRIALRNGQLHERDAATGRPLGEPIDLPAEFVVRGRSGVFASNDLTFSADGDRVLDISAEGPAVISWRPGDAGVITGPRLQGLDVFRSSGIKLSDELIACPQFEGLRVFDARTGRLIRHLTAAPNRAAEFSIGGRRVALCRGGRVVHVWDAVDDSIRPSAGPSSGVRHVKFFDDGKTLITFAGDTEWHVCKSPEGVVLSHGEEVPRRYAGYPVPPDDQAEPDSTVQAIDREFHHFAYRLQRELSLAVPSSAPDKPSTIGRWHSSLSPDGKRLLTAGRIPQTGRFENPRPADGKRVTDAGKGDTLRIIDLFTGRVTHSLEVSGLGAWVALSPDGERIAATREDDSAGVVVADTATSGAARPVPGFDPGTVGLWFSPDRRALFGYQEVARPRPWELRRNRFRLVELASGMPRTPIVQVPEDDVNVVAFAPDHRRLMLGGESGRLYVMDALTGTLLATRSGHTGAIRAIDVTPDGTRAATGSDDCTVILWDLTRIPAPLVDGEPDMLWKALAGDDPAAAYRAICGLSDRPEAALELILSRSEVIACPSVEEVRGLIAQLGAAGFQKREAAMRELARYLTVTADRLRAELDDDPAPEIRRRIEQLLRRSVDPGPRLRILRTLELLERIGSPDAIAILERIAEQHSASPFGRDAARTLARLRP